MNTFPEQQKFCKRHGLPEKVAYVLNFLPRCYWEIISQGKREGDSIVVKTAWYNRTVFPPRKVSIQNDILLAAGRAKMKCQAFNILPNKGALGQRVKLIIE